MTPAFGGQYSIQLSYGRFETVFCLPGAQTRKRRVVYGLGWLFSMPWRFLADRTRGIICGLFAANWLPVRHEKRRD